MRVTFYGQSCLTVELAGKSLLFDPFIRQNERARDVDVSAIRADYILVAHGHFGHAADLAGRTSAPVIANGQVGHGHHDTFPPIRIDHEDAKKRFAAVGKELILLPIGSSHDF